MPSAKYMKKYYKKHPDKYEAHLETMRIYMGKYWKEHPDKYQAHIERARKKSRTKEGKEYLRKNSKKFRLKNKTYMSEYGKYIRLQRKKKGICIRCGKVKVRTGYVSCKKSCK